MTQPTFIAGLFGGQPWLLLEFLGMILLTALITWLLCRWFYRGKNVTATPAVQANTTSHVNTAKVAAGASALTGAALAAANAKSQADKEANSKLKADRDNARKEVESLKAQLVASTKDVVPGAKLREAEAALKSFQEESSVKVTSLEKVKVQYEELKKEKQALSTKLEGIQKDTIGLSQFNEVQRKLAEQSKEGDGLRQALADAQSKAQQATEALIATRSEGRNAQNELSQIKKDLSNRTTARDDMASARHQAEDELTTTKDEVVRLKAQLKEISRGNAGAWNKSLHGGVPPEVNIPVSGLAPSTPSRPASGSSNSGGTANIQTDSASQPRPAAAAPTAVSSNSGATQHLGSSVSETVSQAAATTATTMAANTVASVAAGVTAVVSSASNAVSETASKAEGVVANTVAGVATSVASTAGTAVSETSNKAEGAIASTLAAAGTGIAASAAALASTVSAGPNFREASKFLGEKVDSDRDLTLVEGIGPKIQIALNEMGIETWADLSKANLQAMRDQLGKFNYHTAVPDTWPEQAALLHAGKWAEFKALCDVLVGGIRPV